MRPLETDPVFDDRPVYKALRFIGWSLIIFLAYKLASCGHVDVHWKEEVMLASGQKIVVKRTAKGETLGEIGGPGGWRSTVMTLEIVDPKSAAHPPVWSEPWVPMVFDVDPDTGHWFVIATFYMCEDWYALGRPKLPYLQFVQTEGRWERVPLEEKFFGRESNLLTGPRSGGEPRLVTLKEKSGRNLVAAEKFRSVLAVWVTGC